MLREHNDTLILSGEDSSFFLNTMMHPSEEAIQLRLKRKAMLRDAAFTPISGGFEVDIPDLVIPDLPAKKEYKVSVHYVSASPSRSVQFSTGSTRSLSLPAVRSQISVVQDRSFFQTTPVHIDASSSAFRSVCSGHVA